MKSVIQALALARVVRPCAARFAPGIAILAAALSLAAGIARAQPVIDPTAASSAGPPPAPSPAVAPEGTVVLIAVAEPLSTKTIKRGDFFAIRLASPITIGDRVVAQAGATGEGQVVDAASSGPLGRPAKLLLAARYLNINGVRVALRAMKLGAAGKDETTTILAINLVPYIGILSDFMHGGEIEIPADTLAQAKLDADFTAPPLLPAASPAPPQPAQQGAAQ